ncbi:MAG: hypothetical protein VCC36_00105, partial [Gammaproteobacteria bacterium]
HTITRIRERAHIQEPAWIAEIAVSVELFDGETAPKSHLGVRLAGLIVFGVMLLCLLVIVAWVLFVSIVLFVVFPYGLLSALIQ